MGSQATAFLLRHSGIRPFRSHGSLLSHDGLLALVRFLDAVHDDDDDDDDKERRRQRTTTTTTTKYNDDDDSFINDNNFLENDSNPLEDTGRTVSESRKETFVLRLHREPRGITLRTGFYHRLHLHANTCIHIYKPRS